MNGVGLKYLVFLLIILSLGSAQEITIWTSFDGLEQNWLEDQSRIYSELFAKEVKIVQLKTGEINQRLLLSLRDTSIELPDLIVGIAHNQIPRLSQEGLLANLQKYSTADYLSDLSANARKSFTENEQLLGFPLFLQGPALIRNKKLAPEEPKTFDNLLEAAEALQSDEIKGFQFDIANLYFAYPFLSAYGGRLFKNGELSILDDDFKKGVEFLRDLRYKYHLFDSSPGYKELFRDFYFGKLAFIYDGPWAIPEYQKQIDLGVSPLPTRSGLELNGLASAYGVVLLKKDEDDLNSVNLAKWLIRPEAQLALAESAFKVPASLTAIKALHNEVLIGFARALTNAELIPTERQMGDVWGPLSDALFKILVSPDSNISGILEQAVQDIKMRQ